MMELAHKAVIVAADNPAVLAKFYRHRNPAVRQAAKHMGLIASMHDLGDCNFAREYQIASDAIFYLPFPQIRQLVALL